MTTAAAGGRGANATLDTRKTNFNVLLEEEEVESTASVSVEKVKKDEESLEQLLAAAVVSPTSSTEDSIWATATSKHPHTKKKTPYQPRQPTTLAPTGTLAAVAPQIAAHSQQPSTGGHPRHAREPINLSEETTLEFYDFPAAFRTQDLKAALERFQAGRYRLKWNNDTSCWFVFDGVEAREEAIKVVEAYIAEKEESEKFKVRVYKAEYYQTAETVGTA